VTDIVLIAGVSVRGFAESAVRAGYAVAAVDAFADLDLIALAAEARQVRPYTAGAAARSASGVPAAAVCYVSNFENHPAALRRLADSRTLWGNSSDTLAGARDPAAVASALVAAGLPAARARVRAPRPTAPDAARRWLLKPLASGGGHGITPWSTAMPVRRTSVLQERISGHPGSVLFSADGRQAVVHGVTRQLIGDRHFGARDFRYCGNLLAPPDDPDWGTHSPLAQHGAVVASVLTRAFGLVGVNGIDVIVRRGRVVPIEINPRYTAAMELAERRDGISIFGAHVAGCSGHLGAFVSPPPRPVAVGKAIVFARRPVVARATQHWLADPDIRDVPAAGTAIPSGAPICTVFATGATMAECHARLVQRAARIYAEAERPSAALLVPL